VLQGLNTKYPVYLLSDKGEKVPLIVKEYNEGQFYLAQALLKPGKALEMGESYTLQVDSLPQYETLERYNSSLGEYEKVRFTVSKTADMEKPELRSVPVFAKEEYGMMGCGPLHYMHFSMKVQDRSLLLVKATVKEPGSGTSVTYYVLSDGTKLALGHGMCSGAFTFQQGKDYDVRFSFMDISGNMAGTGTAPLRIHVFEAAAAVE